MRALGILAGAALLALTSAAASAADVTGTTAGATAGVPMQAGSAWGHGGGWQGGAPTSGDGYVAGGANAGGDMGPPPGAWHHAPPRWNGGGDYQRPVRGWKVPRHYRDRDYVVSDWNGWGFGEPGPGMSWIRYYDDALLVDSAGRVVDCRYGVNWDGGYRSGGGYAGRPGYGYPQGPGGYGQPGGYPGRGGPPPGYGYPQPGTTTYRAGPNTTVSTTVTPLGVPAVYAAGGCGACGGTVVSVTPGMAVTTTTTTVDYQTVYKSVAVRRKAWKRPIRHYHPRCVQTTCAIQGS
ncbi:RcnB family protein [Sphingomonas abietis]|uniref:RcnB family protein n=1 Tax=Sphingomonas abietis TaxID=3012344 RepID=A0ABY7NP55_9SPHN|nr:RcnB family protein [Sphingomonas abietis]WBO23319.1 RcnB family protein [Sphingomonas abietis]